MTFPHVNNHRYHFDTIEAFKRLISAVVSRHNRRNEALLRDELAQMLPLPISSGVDCIEHYTKVSSSSTITVKRVVYRVPRKTAVFA